MIEARDIHFSYRGRAVLKGATLSLGTGELVCLLGANGAGKSTLLKILLGLLKPAAGKLSLGGTALGDIDRRSLARQVAYVPQVHTAPFPYTVRQVVLMGRLPATGLLRAAGAADRRAAEQALDHLAIGHLAERPYTEVSGGERQMALIARALAQDARLLVMDEPLAGLDYGHQQRLLARLESLAGEGYGVLMTTHDPDQPLSGHSSGHSGGCHRVATLIDGRIAVDGAPAEVLTPAAIHQLYGVRVELLRAANGRGIAFRPSDRSSACLP